ncbi:MAG: putative sulfate exporter family transporter [Alphaproteobacteria bacterium]|nr:putative sulfate exporter family transporter [Alphaproteobacteria bacterium]
MQVSIKQIVFILFGLVCLMPHVSAAIALLIGLTFVLVLGNPFSSHTKSWSSKLLAFSIVGLGAGMDLSVVMNVGMMGIVITAVSIGLTLLTGWLLAKVFKLGGNTSSLISVGTAICGGSAIAAVSPILKAKENEIAVALGIVFMLNAFALLVFPFIGRESGMSEYQFALWSALAIHDTSSVVGATMQYGEEALEVGTTLKLVRALWILPIVCALVFYVSKRSGDNEAKIKFPWFILGFIGVVVLVNLLPVLQPIGEYVAVIAKRGLVLALFLIGASLSLESLKQVGMKPLAYGIILWLLIALMASAYVLLWAG